MESRDVRGIALLVALWLVLQIPFVSSAFRVDEPNIVRIAERAAVAPADPYGFYINWNGGPEEAFHILANPPLVPYWLAAWGATLGWTEAVLHIAMLPFSVLAIVALAVLANDLGVRPLAPALLLVASPSFFLASQVVMPDIAMFALFVAAVACAVRYLATGSAWLVPLGFVAGALAPLAKYNGALVGPVLGLLWLAGRGRRTGLLVIAAGPAAGVGLWSFASLMMYGRSHISTIAEFESGGTVVILSAILGYFAFGVLPAVAATSASPPLLPRHLLGAITLLMALLMGVSMYLVFPVGPWAAAGYGLSAGITFRLLLIVGALGVQGVRERDVIPLLLVLWFALVFWFQFGLLFSSVRYMLPLLAPMLLLLVRAGLLRTESPSFRAGLAFSLALTVAIGIGDARTANLYRDFVNDVVVPKKAAIAGRFLFDGHWGFQYYMEREGGTILDFFRQPRLRDGDVVFIARNPFPSYQQLTPTRALAIDDEEIRFTPRWPVRTIDCSAFANFYGPGVRECKGPVLPFGFSLQAKDEFAILTVRRRAGETP
jgi:4-amino-4-deoxy-L-arabinose transferase-like glycosyltransferase